MAGVTRGGKGVPGHPRFLTVMAALVAAIHVFGPRQFPSPRTNSLLAPDKSLFRLGNSLFRSRKFPVRSPQGICPEPVDFPREFATRSAAEGRSLQNSLLNSLFSGNSPHG
jgi:hypothetical protein